MSKLSYEEKKELPKKEFVIKKKKGEMKGSYPIEDKAHARNALARVSQFGSSEEKEKVRKAVHRKFPSIDEKKRKIADKMK
jgi:hypothetical protein